MFATILNDFAWAKDEQLEKLIDEGMIVNENPDLEALKEATRNVYTDFEPQNEWMTDLVSRIREITGERK